VGDDDMTLVSRPFSRAAQVSWYQNVSVLDFMPVRAPGL